IEYGTINLTQSTGQASVTTSSLSVGTHTIKARYNPDSNYQGSHESVSHTVNKSPTTSTLSASANSITYGDSVTFTDTVAPSAATGTVSFDDQFGLIATGSVPGSSPNQTSRSLTSLSAGTHSVSATYGGDSTYAVSTSNTVSVSVAPANTTTALSASPDSTVFGQQVTFTAT